VVLKKAFPFLRKSDLDFEMDKVYKKYRLKVKKRFTNCILCGKKAVVEPLLTLHDFDRLVTESSYPVRCNNPFCRHVDFRSEVPEEFKEVEEGESGNG